MKHRPDPHSPLPRRHILPTPRVRHKLIHSIRVPPLRWIIPHLRPQRLNDIQAANIRVLGRPAPPLGKHALPRVPDVRGRVHDELDLPAGADVLGMAEEGRHPVEVAPPLGAVAVVLREERAVVVGGGLAVPADGPGLVGPGEHEGDVGLAVGEHGEEGLVHDRVAEPVVVEGEAVETV